MKRIVVCATPYSGTKYISHLFNKIGVSCRHETDMSFEEWEKSDIFAYSNFLNVISIENKRSEPPKSTPPSPYHNFIVLHQIRNPLECVNSMLQNGIETEGCQTERMLNQFVRAFIKKKLQPAEIAQWFWLLWNGRIQNLNPHITYAVEQISPKLLSDIEEQSGIKIPDGALSFLDEVPKNIHSRANDRRQQNAPVLQKEDLFPELWDFYNHFINV